MSSLLRIPTPRKSFYLDLNVYMKQSYWRSRVFSNKQAYFKISAISPNHNMGLFVSIANKPFKKGPLEKLIKELEDAGYKGGVVKRVISGNGEEEVSFTLIHNDDEDPSKSLSIKMVWSFNRSVFSFRVPRCLSNNHRLS